MSTVEGGQAIVDRAVEAFGRVDVLVNNAGILRDKSFVKLEPESWNAVLDVHLNGVYNVTRPAFLRMKSQGYGRIVMTSSAAGLFGNFGQANYGAAKMGQVGLMASLKLEGERYDVKVNTVAPLATTRLTEDVLPPDMQDKLKAEYVSPLVLYLGSEGCPVTGNIYGAGAGFYHRIAVVCGPGAVVGDGDAAATPEGVAKAWKAIRSLADPEEYADATASLAPVLEGGRKAPPEAEEGAADGGAVAAVFDGMPGAFKADAAAGVDVVFQYDISGDGGGHWNVTIRDGACEVAEGTHDTPTTTITMESGDFLAMIGGTLNPMAAYTGGKLKIGGDLMKSQLIEKLFDFGEVAR